MKICKKCYKETELDSFYKNKNNNDGLGTWCKECTKTHKKEHYKNNKESYLNNGYKNRKWFYDIKKEMRCEKCGFDHPAALDFHHIDPKEKEFTIGKIHFTNPKLKDKILKEIAKCKVLCSNCHRIEHNTQYWRYNK